MPKIDPKKINADWSRYEKRPPWGHITSAELADVLDVHIQTISNWKLRGILPQPERIKGNKNRYRLSSIKSWQSAKDENSIIWDWIRAHISESIRSIEQAQYVVRHCYAVLGVEKA